MTTPFAHYGEIMALLAEDGARLTLDDRRCILNPGSVGQPRDGDPRACAMTSSAKFSCFFSIPSPTSKRRKAATCAFIRASGR